MTIRRMDQVGVVVDDNASVKSRSQDSYRLCYVRGRESINVALAEQFG
jgi:hypothetical protein